MFLIIFLNYSCQLLGELFFQCNEVECTICVYLYYYVLRLFFKYYLNLICIIYV